MLFLFDIDSHSSLAHSNCGSMRLALIYLGKKARRQGSSKYWVVNRDDVVTRSSQLLHWRDLGSRKAAYYCTEDSGWELNLDNMQ